MDKRSLKLLTQLSLCVLFCAPMYILAAEITFSSINRYSQSSSDLDEVDDSRGFTSEALFSESSSRLNRKLTLYELYEIARAKQHLESFNKLRLIFERTLTFDLHYKYKESDKAQITNFYNPTLFNSVTTKDYGLTIKQVLNIDQIISSFEGVFSKTNRAGVIEFFPKDEEEITNYIANIIFTRVYGKKAATLYATYLYQDISPNISTLDDRDRYINALSYSYGNQSIGTGFHYDPSLTAEKIVSRRYDYRGLDLFAGFIHDSESYWTVDVTNTDYFVGTSAKINDLDFVIQVSYFKSEHGQDHSQDNAQFRTELLTHFQLDKHKLLIFPFRYDSALEGPDYFDNVKMGTELLYVTKSIYGFDNTSLSANYHYQYYRELDKGLHLFNLQLAFSL